MISLLVTLLVLILVGALLWWVIGMIPLPSPFARVAQIVLALIFVIVLLGLVFGGVNVPMLRVTP